MCSLLGEKNKIKTEREANHKRLLNTENKLRVAGGEVGGGSRGDEIGRASCRERVSSPV